MAKLLESFGPLQSFSAKISVAYAFDLIGEWMYRDLEAIRGLRNEFAHGVRAIRFDAPEVVKFTKHLVGANLAAASMMREEAEQDGRKRPGGATSSGTESSRLVSATERLASRIQSLKVSTSTEDETDESRHAHGTHEKQEADDGESRTSALERARLMTTVSFLGGLLTSMIEILRSDIPAEVKETCIRSMCR